MASAQLAADYRKAADNYFKRGDYSSAISYYEKYLNGGKAKQAEFDPYTSKMAGKQVPPSDKLQAVYQLAESWRLLKNYTNAAPLYAQIADDYNTYPLGRYHYATSLRALGKYSEAEKALKDFLATYTTEDQYKKAAQREILNLQFIQEQLGRGAAAYVVQPVSGGRTGASYAPVQLTPDTLLFTATWPDSSAPANKVHVNRLYKAVFSEGAIAGVTRANEIPSGQMHEGVASVSADGNTLYLTRWSVNKDKKSASIYISKKSTDGVKWSNPSLLDTIVNTPGSNTQQPFLTPDGKHLLYASDRPGGLGGYDLWMAELDVQGKPVSTVNLGNVINTSFNEQAPYYHAASSTLVFATDGRTGMGGYDLFYSKGAIGYWGQPENFGYPVNSVKDDMYFVSYGKGKKILESVLLSSDRADVCCLELFHLAKKDPLKQVIGQVVACDTKTPLPGVAITVVDIASGKQVYSGATDADGIYSFTIESATPLSSVATLKGYYTTSQSMQLPDAADELDSLVSTPVCMQKEVVVTENITVLRNVYYEFAKADIRPESFASLDDVVDFLKKNTDVKAEIGGHTDNKGSDELNLRLSEARAVNVVNYLVSKGIEKNRLIAKGYGATQPIAPNVNEDGSDNPEGREKNRRTEMKILK
ncbi:flagellar motor protein MotB [Filimonas effusa]|uniref:Flagellar motor protein MotB n=2 Tax=Filimonas effusa TaxID=2508721 RepID=A0A4Q1DFJ3_9BACT|nr:flagellar motor protein MotB [Filimonas effusa]